jgi:hypothetical protein
MNQDHKLNRFAEKELLRNLDQFILQDDDGTVVAFGQYLIERSRCGFAVRTRSDSEFEFSDRRTALTWCTLDKMRLYTEACQVMALERKRQLLEADINCMRSTIRKVKNHDFKDTLHAKLSPKIGQHRAIMGELEKLANRAKYLQIKGFSNETARTIGSTAK